MMISPNTTLFVFWFWLSIWSVFIWTITLWEWVQSRDVVWLLIALIIGPIAVITTGNALVRAGVEAVDPLKIRIVSRAMFPVIIMASTILSALIWSESRGELSILSRMVQKRDKTV